MSDHEAAAAAEAIARRLRVRDAEDHPEVDDEVLARELIVMLQGRGWRPTEAKPPPHWKQFTRPRTSVPPDAPSPGVSAYREARLELEHQLIEAGAMDDEAIRAHMDRGSEHNRILRENGAA